MDSKNVAMQSSSGNSSSIRQPCERENFSDYVAELQLHMTLQARNLVPSMNPATTHVSDHRATLLHEAQALVEKQISRQI